MKPNNKKELSKLDFEIKFFEGILKEKPNFIQALLALGDTYTKRGLFEQGLSIDKRLTGLRPDDPVVWYNLACSYSLMNDTESAFKAINKSLLLGYDDFDFIEKDPDLENLKKDARFKDLIKSCKVKNE